MSKKELNLGRVLTEHRRKRGVTQEELAEHMGVSKASVSKWETGAAYPDITLLPKLAAYFDLSIDALLCYEPQMTTEDIRKLYRRLSHDFVEKPFPEVLEACRETAKQYFSCFPLLLQIGALMVNHCMLAGTPEQTAAVSKEALRLFQRVRQESGDTGLIVQATNLEALCLLQLNRPQEVFLLLDSASTLRFSIEPLLSQAYLMTGKPEEAKTLLQVGIYQSMLELLQLLSSYITLCKGDEAAMRESCKRMLAVTEIFHLPELHPGTQLSLYLAAAQGLQAVGDREGALKMLKAYTDLALSKLFPLKLHGDEYFDRLDGWLEENLILGNSPPRDEQLIRRDVMAAFLKMPGLQPLRDDPVFLDCMKRLQAGREAMT